MLEVGDGWELFFDVSGYCFVVVIVVVVWCLECLVGWFGYGFGFIV